MLIKAKVLIKGTGAKPWKDKTYHTVEVYGIEGAPADCKVDVDYEKQRPLYDLAGKNVAKIVDMAMDVTFWNGQARFNLVGFDVPK